MPLEGLRALGHEHFLGGVEDGEPDNATASQADNHTLISEVAVIRFLWRSE